METRFLARDAGGLTRGALKANGRLRAATRSSRMACNAGPNSLLRKPASYRFRRTVLSRRPALRTVSAAARVWADWNGGAHVRISVTPLRNILPPDACGEKRDRRDDTRDKLVASALDMNEGGCGAHTTALSLPVWRSVLSSPLPPLVLSHRVHIPTSAGIPTRRDT